MRWSVFSFNSPPISKITSDNPPHFLAVSIGFCIRQNHCGIPTVIKLFHFFEFHWLIWFSDIIRMLCRGSCWQYSESIDIPESCSVPVHCCCDFSPSSFVRKDFISDRYIFNWDISFFCKNISSFGKTWESEAPTVCFRDIIGTHSSNVICVPFSVSVFIF